VSEFDKKFKVVAKIVPLVSSRCEFVPALIIPAKKHDTAKKNPRIVECVMSSPSAYFERRVMSLSRTRSMDLSLHFGEMDLA
jgi:hypothetical protein